MSDKPEEGRVFGIDVSNWTGVVDWDAAKAAGVAFVFIKFMDGLVRARLAKEHYKGAKDAGILVGAYHWLRAEIDVGRQAREYVAMLRDFPCDIRPAVDFEWAVAGFQNPTAQNLWGFSDVFLREFGFQPMIYTAPGYWAQYGNSAARWSEHPLWIAHYRVREPVVPRPWKRWDFWQFSESGDGKRYGAQGEKGIDLNYWRGSMAELLEFCGKDVVDGGAPRKQIVRLDVDFATRRVRIYFDDGSEQEIA